MRKITKKVDVYKAFDGKEFSSEIECRQYEEEKDYLDAIKKARSLRATEYDGIVPLVSDFLSETASFVWYRLSDDSDLKTLNRAYCNALHNISSPAYPAVVCVETEVPYQSKGYLITLEQCMQNAKEFFGLCGYDVHFEENGFTWNALYTRALDSACGEPALKAKDEARFQVRELVMKEFGLPDLEKEECPEDKIQDYCEKFNIRFDEKGNIIHHDKPSKPVGKEIKPEDSSDKTPKYDLSVFSYDHKSNIANIIARICSRDGLMSFSHEVRVTFRKLNGKWTFIHAFDIGAGYRTFHLFEKDYFEKCFPGLLQEMKDLIYAKYEKE